MAQGEIVADRILRIEYAQVSRDLLRCPPAHVLPVGQPKAARDPRHVGVERDDQGRSRHTFPDPQVYGVGAADHPAQEEVPLV
jgi:hypothetical protein